MFLWRNYYDEIHTELAKSNEDLSILQESTDSALLERDSPLATLL